MEKESHPSEQNKDALKALLEENKMTLGHWHLGDRKIHTFVLTEPLFSACDDTAYRIAKRIADRYIVRLVPRDIAHTYETPDYRYFFAVLMDKDSEAGTIIPVLAEAKKAFESSLERLVDLAVTERM